MSTADHNVGGVISPRPFRMRRLGHIAYDVDYTEDSLDFTGIDRALFLVDPQGNRIMLYYYMEQIGWGGRPRPVEARAPRETRPVAEWPECIQAPSDVYTDQPLMEPLG